MHDPRLEPSLPTRFVSKKNAISPHRNRNRNLMSSELHVMTILVSELYDKITPSYCTFTIWPTICPGDFIVLDGCKIISLDLAAEL